MNVAPRKTLWLLRHASAAEGADDRSRPLTAEGKEQARRAAVALVARGALPERIVSSPALRAVATAEAVAAVCDRAGGLVVEPRLYPCDRERLLRVLEEIPGQVARVLVVAHCPGLEELASALLRRRVAIPAAGLVRMTVPIESWKEMAGFPRAVLADFNRPDSLPENPRGRRRKG